MMPSRRPPTPAWAALEKALLTAGRPPLFRASHLSESSPVIRRYVSSAIADGTPLAQGVHLRMRGSIKLGRWLPFRARQLLAPRHGSVWTARVGGVVTGSDSYTQGAGSLEWRLLGVVPVMRAEGADVSRSAAGRLAGESVWVPTALASQQPLPARPLDEDRIAVDVVIDDDATVVEHTLDEDGRVVSSRLDRWGDPDGTGECRLVPFGIEVTGWRTFDGVTIPSAGRAGWHHGTDRWEQGEFFRFEIIDYELVVPR
jgi:hypothetical protein